MKLSEIQARNFWKKVLKTDCCWIWKGAKNGKGYGIFGFQGKLVLAHRLMFQIYYGEVPAGKFVCHTCDIRNCVNPAHLWLGTNADNMRDMFAKSRGNRAHGENNGSRLHPESRPRGEASGRAKLTSEKVIEMRRIYVSGGISQENLAKQFNVSQVAVGKIVNRKTWKHI